MIKPKSPVPIAIHEAATKAAEGFVVFMKCIFSSKSKVRKTIQRVKFINSFSAQLLLALIQLILGIITQRTKSLFHKVKLRFLNVGTQSYFAMGNVLKPIDLNWLEMNRRMVSNKVIISCSAI